MFLQCTKDGFEHAIHFLEHLVVPEPQYPESGIFETCRSLCVGLHRIGMLATIQFDHEPSFQACEIDDVVAERMLSTELASVQLAHPQPLPQCAFRIGGCVAKPARQAGPQNPRIGLALHRNQCIGRHGFSKTHPHPTLPGSRVLRSPGNPVLGILPRPLIVARICGSQARRFTPLKGRALGLFGDLRCLPLKGRLLVCLA